MTCAICNRPLPDDDQLPVACGLAHFACIAQVQLAPRLTLAPLVASPPTETISALIGCIVSTHGLASPRLCDPDEATVVERRVGGAR